MTITRTLTWAAVAAIAIAVAIGLLAMDDAPADDGTGTPHAHAHGGPAGSADAGADGDGSHTAGWHRAGPFHLLVEPLDPPLAEGRNRISVQVQSADGAPIDDARVRIAAQRRDAGGEPVPGAPVTTLQPAGDGRYRGELALDAAGDHALAVDAETPALGHGDLTLRFTTGEPGLRATSATPGGIAHYTCSMHPSVREAGPGECPICGMDLVPVTEAEQMSGVITVDSQRRQLIGVETGTAERRVMTRTVRAVGRVAIDERRVSEVSVKFDGWIGELDADFVGKRVQRGQRLLTIYSPELLSAQQEYLQARQRLSGRDRDDSLLRAARQRLLLWDIAPSQIDAIERRGEPMQHLPVAAPVSGTVIEKGVVAGSHARAGQPLLRIADLSRVWIDAEVYEPDLALIEAGMPAEVTLPYLPNAAYRATVDYVYPTLAADSRTGRIRLVLDNADGRLRPEMFARADLAVDLGEQLAVPEAAVIVAGDTRVVFRDLGDGRLEPVRVRTGRRADGWVAITDGLQPGDAVVTSGNFLLAAEAKLRLGIDQW